MNDIAQSLQTIQSSRCRHRNSHWCRQIGGGAKAQRRKDMNALKHITFAAGLGLAPFDAGGAEWSEWRALSDERAVIRIADAIDCAVDAQDWRLARSFFAERVTVDFSSL